MSPLLTLLVADVVGALERLAQDLEPDRPDLASALRTEAARLGGECAPGSRPASRRHARHAMRPLLYAALDAGLLDARAFDRIVLRADRARLALASRQGVSGASPSDS